MSYLIPPATPSKQTPYQPGHLGQVQISPQNHKLASWLMLVNYHSQSGSRESLETLADLASHIPPFDETNADVHAAIEKVCLVAHKMTFDPTLSPGSKTALGSLSTQGLRSIYSDRPKPPAARQLNFFDDVHVEQKESPLGFRSIPIDPNGQKPRAACKLNFDVMDIDESNESSD